MRRTELIGFLDSHRLHGLDAGAIMRSRKPRTVEVAGRPVYLFDMAFDIHDSPIEDSVSISQQPRMTPIPLHMHDYIEMIFVYRGSCRLELEGEPIVLEEGHVILIEKGVPHEVGAAGERDIVINMIMKRDFLSPAFLGRLTRRSIISRFMLDSVVNNRRHRRFLLFRPGHKANVTDLMEQIMCEFFERDVYSDEILDSLLLALFAMLIRSGDAQSEPRPAGDGGESMLVEFLRYIEEHYRTCTLADMGRHFGFHPNYLSTLLKKSTGYSFKELLQLQRLHRAALLLTSSDRPIPEIAEDVGYSSLTFFYKKFKELFGATPKAFRQADQSGA